jgi:hypothetical protein
MQKQIFENNVGFEILRDVYDEYDLLISVEFHRRFGRTYCLLLQDGRVSQTRKTHQEEGSKQSL